MTRLSDPMIGQVSRISSATPAAFWSAISTITTSASSFSAMLRATVAPTLPAPPTTVTLRFIETPEENRLPFTVRRFQIGTQSGMSLIANGKRQTANTTLGQLTAGRKKFFTEIVENPVEKIGENRIALQQSEEIS